MQHAFDTILSELLNGNTVRQLCHLSETPSVLLAVSGGVDSMCMAELFSRTSVPVKFAIAHCNFGLRGQESDSDEALVTSWAELHGVRLHRERFDTIGYAESHGISIEMAARDLRYAWFSKLCEEYGYVALSVAHNSNDNVETLFLNLLRGTGIKGLSGMGKLSLQPSGKGLLMRPLLDFGRKKIEGFAYANHIEYHDDRTNAETEYKRNKLRNLVFPLFEQINPSFIRTLNREMTYFSQVSSIADDYYASRRDLFLRPDKIILTELMSDPNWEYLLFRCLEERGFNPAVISSIADLLKSRRTTSGKIFGSGEQRLVTASDSLIFSPEKTNTEKVIVASGRRGTLMPNPFQTIKSSDSIIVVRGPGNYYFNGVSFAVSLSDWESGMSVKTPAGTIMFDASLMDFPFICRKWENGDWFVPLGMKGKKKVSDFFTDLKYSLLQKDSSVMLVKSDNCGSMSGGRRIAAVLGERIDNELKINNNTKKVIIIKIK